jgi:hypothetical protein
MKLFKYLFLSLFFFMFACAPTEEITIKIPTIEGARIVTSQRIKQEIAIEISKAGISQFNVHKNINDENYLVMTEDDFKSIKRAMFESKPIFSDESFDCDDFALMFKFLAIMGNRSGLEASPAVGILEVRITKEWANVKPSVPGGSGHQLNFVVVADGEDDFKIIIIEPQNLTSIEHDKYPNLRGIYGITM